MTHLSLYNTKTRSIEVFKPLAPPLVTMYACGPTVYDKTHIGHMRKYVGDDILRRTLSLLGYDVRHVMNITDVGHLTNDSDAGEEKLEKGAKKEGKTVWEVAQYYLDYFRKTMDDINVLPPTLEPRATDHVSEMIALVQTLFDKGFAYETNEAIYFDVAKDPHYGELSGQKLSEKSVAARSDVVVDPDKRHPADFALWFKRVGRFADHVMFWPSPWGDGFPGWHIECSAMSMKYLGDTIDIHTGGVDHIPVHHENEIAQSECATGHPFVRFWVHYEFLLVDGEKMSKSKNNFYTIEDIHAHAIDPLAVRLLFMQTSYRKPLNFTWEALEAAQAQLKKLQKFASLQTTIGTRHKKYEKEYVEALTDDLNAPKALAVVWETVNDEALSPADRWATLLFFDEVLGLNLKNVPKFTLSDEAQALVKERDAARAKKDFKTSDKIRKALETLGYEVVDTSDGTTLR
ncbi:MAG TPA: cysteine--tRNA ligase [Candidatus Paceibacterota bacterium]|jgi:cysteinyl-tRNA synthetase|nr:cysteine--tRNA ligase [Candidatus Paceibacterota bacterium]